MSIAETIAAPRPLSDKDFAGVASVQQAAHVNPLADGVFMKHQRQWLMDTTALKICEKGRRTGITFVQAWDDTLTAAKSRSAGGMNCFYIGDSKEKGLEYIGYVKHFAECIGEQLAGLDEYLFEDKQAGGETRMITAYRARFASGYRVEALSSRPANIRGLQGCVTIDEAAFHPDVRGVIAAANALLIWGGKVRIISTHNGVNNPFNQLVKEAKAGRARWRVHTYSFDDAVANGLYERAKLISPDLPPKEEWYAQVRGAYLDKDSEREELDVIPAEGEGAWLTYDVIIACEHELAGKPELYTGGPALIGNDIGARHDLWAAWVWELVGDIFWTREIVTLAKATFARHDAEMDRLMTKYNARVAMDQTGMGEKPVEDAKNRYPGRAEGVILSGPVRLNIATAAKMAFEDKKVRIPAGQVSLRDDLHKLKRVIGDTGNARLVAESDEEGHADRFWAAALGLAANDNNSGALIEHYKRQVGKSAVATAALHQIRSLLGNARKAA
jgi:phage FluMu gp28-like protein